MAARLRRVPDWRVAGVANCLPYVSHCGWFRTRPDVWCSIWVTNLVCPHPIPECSWSAGFTSDSSFLLCCSLEGSGWWLYCLNSCYPLMRPMLCARSLVLSVPRPGWYGHLRNESGWKSSLSASFFCCCCYTCNYISEKQSAIIQDNKQRYLISNEKNMSDG